MMDGKTTTTPRRKRNVEEDEIAIESEDSFENDDDEDIIDTALAAEAISEAMYTSTDGQGLADVLDHHLGRMTKILLRIEKQGLNDRKK